MGFIMRYDTQKTSTNIDDNLEFSRTDYVSIFSVSPQTRVPDK